MPIIDNLHSIRPWQPDGADPYTDNDTIRMADAATLTGNEPTASNGWIEGLRRIPPRTRMALMIAIPATIAALVALSLWSQQPDYRILFTNVGDRDGGAVISALGQMNVPYRISESGNAILVPADRVHETRLRLASQGLPKGSVVGFELMENQKFGVTQFQEQVNYQRALEGELARSIQSLAAVQGARVHLAIPKPSIFMRDQSKPTASVLVNLYPGRSLDRQQVNGILHLVSSSLPDLPLKNVSLVDQDGNLLTPQPEADKHGLDPQQLLYVSNLEQGYVRRIEEILGPVVGSANVRATVVADIDFTQSEATTETYGANQGKDAKTTLRSQQTSEAQTNQPPGAQGVPGALTNQPPGNTTAPIQQTAPGQPQTNNTQPGTNAAGQPVVLNAQKATTNNFEVDKRVEYTRNASGNLRRLSVAVVVNHRSSTDKNGKSTSVPMSKTEMEQVTALVREAMGFQEKRGDTVNVVNAPFTADKTEDLPKEGFLDRPENVQLVKEIGKFGIIALIAALLVFGVIKPLLRQIQPPEPEPLADAAAEAADSAGINTTDEADAEAEAEATATASHEPAQATPLDQARELARQDPRVVANVVKNWVSGGES